MRIALFTDTFAPQVNGVVQTLGRWVDFAVGRGHEVAVIAPRLSKRSRESPATLLLELPSVFFPFYPELRLAVPLDPWNARRLRTFAPDIVHIATEATVGWSGMSWATAESLPVFTSFHTDIPAYLAGYGLAGLERGVWRYLRGFHDRAIATFCPSNATRDQLLKNGFHDRLRIWSRGVDARLFTPERRCDAVRQRLAPGARRLLVYVGRLAPEKRLGVLLDAFAMLRDGPEGDDADLVIVGDGPAAASLRNRAGEGVHFTGYLSGEALADVYAAGDIFVFPSDTETFGNVVLEAMASGLPVIGAAAGGVLDTVRQGHNGLLAEPRNAASFANAMRRLLGDDSFRSRLAAGARASAAGRSWDSILSGLFDSYAAAMVPAASRVA
jgi:glycosyltransferase involved in cell wall biosynthesis